MTMRAALLLILLGMSAYGDTLILRNGTRVTGRWFATDGNVISFLVNNRRERYSRSEVAEVVFGNQPSANSPAAPQKP
jgi:hypothetical protein